MLIAVMVFPVLVTGGIEKQVQLSTEQIMEQMQQPKSEDATPPAEMGNSKDIDPMKALMDEAAKDAVKTK